MIKRFLLYLRTISYLKPIQLLFLIYYRLRVKVAGQVDIPQVVLRPGVGFDSGPVDVQPCTDTSTFVFLNQEKQFSSGIDWVSKDMPKLWRYNLHYFDYLQDPQRSAENKSRLITDWIRHNPPGTDDAWEPYTVSLRIVNWIKFFLSLKRERSCSDAGQVNENQPCLSILQPEWLQSLYWQAQWLEQHIEYHILANHYLKNGVALFFVGVYFQGGDADRWLQKGVQILREELQEQFLSDGGHFERSPMYHSICVGDYLDVLNLVQGSRSAISLDGMSEFSPRLINALDFLENVCLPDGNIALFNDSAFGIAPTPRQIMDYAKRVIGYTPPARSLTVAITAQLASGYYSCRDAEDLMIIDCGPIGPDYQPGHAHCDTLSYELALNGQRVIVDSGVFDYQASAERVYARGTRAHNTVMINGQEQSEVWGVFRVARRAKPLYASIKHVAAESVVFTGAHDGYMRLKGKPIHHRQVAYDGSSWVITDRVEGVGVYRMESFIHIHPDVTIEKSGGHRYLLGGCGGGLATIEVLSYCDAKIEQGWYFPAFNIKQENQVMVLACSGEAPLELRYRIQKVLGCHMERAI